MHTVHIHTWNSTEVALCGVTALSEPSSSSRSPLHFACAVEDFLECTYALLERGARVYQKDALGVRPVDLNNVSGWWSIVASCDCVQTIAWIYRIVWICL